MKPSYVSVRSLMVVVVFVGLNLAVLRMNPSYLLPIHSIVFVALQVSGVLGWLYLGWRGRPPERRFGGAVVGSIVGALLLAGAAMAFFLIPIWLDPGSDNHMNFFRSARTLEGFLGLLFLVGAYALPIAGAFGFVVGLLVGAGLWFARPRLGPGAGSQRPTDPSPGRRS